MDSEQKRQIINGLVQFYSLMPGYGARSRKLVRWPLRGSLLQCGSSSNCSTYRFSAPVCFSSSKVVSGRLHDDVHTLRYTLHRTVMLAAIRRRFLIKKNIKKFKLFIEISSSVTRIRVHIQRVHIHTQL